MPDEEEWRDIPGFEGYQASTRGRLRSSRHKQFASIGWLILKPSLSPSGYLMAKLSDSNFFRFTRGVHGWVALAFHGPVPSGRQIRHLDGNKLNNSPGNLRYGTAKENAADKVIHGTQARGSAHHSGKLHESQVLAIRESLTHGATAASLAAKYGVTETAIFAIKKRKTWAWLNQSHQESVAA